jgi:hypothetical protein
MSSSLVYGMRAEDARKNAVAFWESTDEDASALIKDVNSLECALEMPLHQGYRESRIRDIFGRIEHFCHSPEDQSKYVDRLTKVLFQNSQGKEWEDLYWRSLYNIDSRKDICLVLYDSLINHLSEKDRFSFASSFLGSPYFWGQGSKFYSIREREVNFLGSFDLLSPFLREDSCSWSIRYLDGRITRVHEGSPLWCFTNYFLDGRITQEERDSLLRHTLRAAVSRKDISELGNLVSSSLSKGDNTLMVMVSREMIRSRFDLELTPSICHYLNNEVLLSVFLDIVKSRHDSDYAFRNFDYLSTHTACFWDFVHGSSFYREVAACMMREGYGDFLPDFLRWKAERIVPTLLQGSGNLLLREEENLSKYLSYYFSFSHESREGITRDIFMIIWKNLPSEECRQYFAVAALNKPSLPNSIKSFALHHLAEKNLMLSLLDEKNLGNLRPAWEFIWNHFQTFGDKCIGNMFVGTMGSDLSNLTGKSYSLLTERERIEGIPYSPLTEEERILMFRRTIQETVVHKDRAGLRRLMEFFSNGSVFSWTEWYKKSWQNFGRKDDTLVGFLIGECVCHDIDLASVFDYEEAPVDSEARKRVLPYIFDLMSKNYRSLDEISFFKNLDVLLFNKKWALPYEHKNQFRLKIEGLTCNRNALVFLPAFLRWKASQFEDRGRQHEDLKTQSRSYFKFYKACRPFLSFSSDEEAADFLHEILVTMGPYCYDNPRTELSGVLSQKEGNAMAVFYMSLYQDEIKKERSVTNVINPSTYVLDYGTITTSYIDNDGNIDRIEKSYFRVEKDRFSLVYEEETRKGVSSEQTSNPVQIDQEVIPSSERHLLDKGLSSAVKRLDFDKSFSLFSESSQRKSEKLPSGEDVSRELIDFEDVGPIKVGQVRAQAHSPVSVSGQASSFSSRGEVVSSASGENASLEGSSNGEASGTESAMGDERGNASIQESERSPAEGQREVLAQDGGNRGEATEVPLPGAAGNTGSDLGGVPFVFSMPGMNFSSVAQGSASVATGRQQIARIFTVGLTSYARGTKGKSAQGHFSKTFTEEESSTESSSDTEDMLIPAVYGGGSSPGSPLQGLASMLGNPSWMTTVLFGRR